MGSVIRDFVRRVKKSGAKRSKRIETAAMGRTRIFEAWDIGADTYIFEDSVLSHLEERPSVLIVDKKVLRSKAKGRVFTMTTGNHSVAAFPLLDGRFWKLSCVPKAKRSEVLLRHILCANVVRDTIEISQREVAPKILFAADEWLKSTVGFTMRDIVMGDRNVSTIEHYHHLGQEWRVKPLAWTRREMDVALAAARKRISSKLTYYHSMKGVHFLTFAEFRKFCCLAESDMPAYIKGLKELVSVYEGNKTSFTRMSKYRGHHEIEFFGLKRGVALERLVPELEKLMEAIELGRIGALGIIQRTGEILSIYASLLSSSDFSDDAAKTTVETLYMCITGEIYSVAGEGTTPAFDDRKTALPGATFVDGRPVFHPGADERSEVLLTNIRRLVSKDEIIEYANVYELRTDDENAAIGQGRTREIVYKTNRNPLEQSMIEKLLSRATKGYSSYMLSRIRVFKALGISLSEYRILRRYATGGRRRFVDVYVRKRCEGEPMDAIPENYFKNTDDSSLEEAEVVLALASLMGDAAAQNMAMKKFDPAIKSPLYGIGKEIYEFEYDIMSARIVPKRVSTCSVRGTFGWPCLDHTDENVADFFNFYLTHFAHALKDYARRHTVEVKDLAARFMDGFEYRTRAMAWQLSIMRDRFEAFKPDLPASYGFDRKWRFAMWALERQERRLALLRKMFFEKTAVI